ncbi:protein kri1-like isoform X2 [Bidens hawaiensis]
MGMKLFGDDGDSDAGDLSKIEINKEYARRFEHNKKREDLQRFEELKKKGLIDDSEEEVDESTDNEEDIVNYSTKQDLKFFDALIKVRNKDPSLKSEDAKLFDSDDEEDDEEEEDETEAADGKKEKKKKKMYLKDVNAKHLLESGPEFDDDEEEDEEHDYKNKKKSYVEELEVARKEFLDAVAAEDDDDDGELLKVKNNNNEDEDEDNHEYEKKLDEYFKEDDKLDENEKFLKDYFRKKMWLEKDNGNEGVFDEVDVLEDEEELEKQEDYERGFNFRYEENAGDLVFGHSRLVEGSVRKKDNARKAQRMSKKERMEQAEFERNEEVKRLKNLKKKEMNEKLRKIRETAGIGENGECLLDEYDLEEEFDPEEYDRKMKKAFNDNFYEADDVDPGFGSEEEDGELEKPNFDEEDELLGLPKGWDDENGPVDGFLAIREKTLKKKVKNEGNEEQIEKKVKKSKRAELEDELIKKEMEEYLKLDCEDTIGDLRTRFKYKPVNKNTCGLKPEEILIVDEKELNQIVPLKKLATYRDDEFVVPHHKRKEHRKRIKALIRGESSDGQTKDSKKRKHEGGQTETQKSEPDVSEPDVENDDKKELSRKQRRKLRLNELKIDDKRRMAYEGTTNKSNKKKKQKF